MVTSKYLQRSVESCGSHPLGCFGVQLMENLTWPALSGQEGFRMSQISQSRDFSLGSSEGQGHCGGPIIHLCILQQVSWDLVLPALVPHSSAWYVQDKKRAAWVPHLLLSAREAAQYPILMFYWPGEGPHAHLSQSLARADGPPGLLDQSGLTLRYGAG